MFKRLKAQLSIELAAIALLVIVLAFITFDCVIAVWGISLADSAARDASNSHRARLSGRPLHDGLLEIGAGLDQVWTALAKTSPIGSAGGVAPSLIVSTPNDAHHWRRASDARNKTRTRSRRPVNVLG